MKKTVAIILLSAGLCLMSGCSHLLNSITLKVPDNQELITGKTILIDAETGPVSVKIDPNSITSTGGDTWVENGYINFEATEPGSYNISVNQNGVQSNTVSITVTGAPGSVAAKTQNKPQDDKDKEQKESDKKSSESSSEASSEDPLASAAKTVQNKKMSVDQVYDDADSIIDSGNLISVQGQLPQAQKESKSGKMVQVMWNPDISEYIILDGFNVPFGNCPAEATGTLSRNSDGELILHMTYITADSPNPVQ